MYHLCARFFQIRSTQGALTLACLCAALILSAPQAGAADRPVRGRQTWKQPAPPPPRSAMLTLEDWQKAPLTPLESGEIDRMVAAELERTKISPAPLTTDEEFIRRVSLDLTGELPVPFQVNTFIASTDPQKRAKLIDRLLESDAYTRHWARYWREVLVARVTDRKALVLARSFEVWLAEQFKRNQSWDRIVRAMITAEGAARDNEPGKNGAAFFLAAHSGNDAANERAAETARVFLGIQIQCAQCHDHPSDQWKRVQFHELAAYFARTGDKPLRDEGRFAGLMLISLPQGEHEMPSKEDPKKSFITFPRFLDGQAPRQTLGDRARRQALADVIVDPKNYWFAGAYVNRMWGELMGQSFYQPVDDMGPKKEAVYAAVLTRLTGSFRASRYDVKGLFRDIMNTQTYQRQIRLNNTTDQQLHFAAAYPTRLRADVLWHELINVLGDLGVSESGQRVMGQGQVFGAEMRFNAEFGFDPSLKPDEVEGSLTQALMLMNDTAINQRITAQGKNLLGRILQAYQHDDEALRRVYERTLARKPTDRELQKCLTYIQQSGKRAEAFEDVLWVILNSTEFQTKR
jgi:hypothetical protein